MNKYEEAVKAIQSNTPACGYTMLKKALGLAVEVLQEKIAEQKKDWHREPELYEGYFVVTGYKEIIDKIWNMHKDDRAYYDNFNCFHCSEYTKEQLIADGVPDMGLVERIHYQYGHAHGDWLTEEERLNGSLDGYGAIFDIGNNEWRATCFCDFYTFKLFKNKSTAEGLCEWLNANCDHRGHTK